MKLAIAGLLCLVALVAAQSEEDWHNYKVKYGKIYRSAEDFKRKEMWRENMRKIVKHNEEAARGLHSYILGENEFADLSFDEFKQQYLGYRPPIVQGGEYHVGSSRRVSDQVDLRNQGLVTSVKNQGSCGSCWAFSSVVAMEGAWANAGNKLVDLSEQQLVDCATKTPGCNGGWMNPTFEYIRDNGGIQSRQSYPYTATNGTCKANTLNNVAFIKGPTAFKNIAVRDHAAIQNVVESGIPVAIAVYVDDTFQLYKGGIFDRANSQFDNMFNLNHAITVVGYDFSTADGYYIVKNSWGTSWGEKGYINLRGTKGGNNYETAGMLQKASYPVV